MKVFPPLIAAGFAVSAVLASPTVDAVEVERQYTLGAAGACQPFAPTGLVRYSSTGLRNSGTTQFYAACSMEGDYRGDFNIGGYNAEIVVANRGTTPQTVACTLRPGWVNGGATSQGAFPKSMVIEPGEQQWFIWNANNLSDSPSFRIANPNFTCTVKPGIEITHLNFRFTENVGD